MNQTCNFRKTSYKFDMKRSPFWSHFLVTYTGEWNIEVYYDGNKPELTTGKLSAESLLFIEFD